MDVNPHIVLLHGFGEDRTIFDKQADALSQHYAIFAPDLPGSGALSGHKWQENTASIDWIAEWVKDEIVKKGINNCILLGHSMGGYITLAFAEKYPEYLRGFGLLHSTAFADAETKKETRRKAIAFMEEKGAHTFLKTSIPGLFGPDFLKNQPEAVNGLVEKGMDFTVETLSAYYKAMIDRPDRTRVLKKSGVPVLLVAGTDDNAIPLTDLLKQAALPAICHFHILQHTGHMGMMEDPLNLSSILLKFAGAVW